MDEYQVTDLSKYGYREIKKVADLLNAWVDQGLPEGFSDDGVTPAFNMHSGEVFLTNEDYQVLMLNDGKLEIWYTLPYIGEEGFISDLIKLDPNRMNQDDIDYIQQFVPTYGRRVA
jgi:hypothetical protein